MTPEHLAVVVPAHDEEDLLPGCLTALDAARTHLLRAVPDVTVSVVVVLDRCTDRSAEVARSVPGVMVLAGDHGSVGAARHAGVRSALEGSDGSLGDLWIANTDADTVVPHDWLMVHHRLAGKNDLVLGTVRPSPTTGNEERLRRWSQAYVPEDDHRHIHGANLGVRASTYQDVGGFRALTQDEDVDLVDRVKATGAVWTASGALQVMTSSRTVGRVPAGFSTYLRMLG